MRVDQHPLRCEPVVLRQEEMQNCSHNTNECRMPKIKAAVNGSINKSHMIYIPHIYQYVIYFNMYNLLVCIHCAIYTFHQISSKESISIFSHNRFLRVCGMNTYDILSLQISRVQQGVLNKSHLAAPTTPRLIHLAQLSPYTCEKQRSVPPASLVPGKDRSPSAAVLSSTSK